MHDDQLSETITRPNNRMSENSEAVSERVNWRNAHRDIEETDISIQVGILVVGAKIAAKLIKFEYYKTLVK